jgi:hypothetical protein
MCMLVAARMPIAADFTLVMKMHGHIMQMRN